MPPQAITISVTENAALETELDTAVASLVSQRAPDWRQGILVTSHSPATYTVQFSPDVPSGEIHELRCW
ncbi:hypothetical protein GCM10023346_47900 [Arthrobacter gyeryongensis]|uniref:Uncharacterized protein n=1 Tax=Arthrobacter gyeryongensis TaxID=1650592 RepID=A0ABP9SVL5_9MICC